MIPYSRQSISEDDINAVTEVLRSDFLTQGPKIEEFEKGLAEYFGADHAICCSSGTAALHLAYAGMGADQQSIAIVPAVTFSATANAFKYLGSEILFCDIIPDTGILCLNHLEELLSTINPSKFSKVFIVAVSFAGNIPPLTRLKEISEKYQCVLIEDASHSFGASHIESTTGEITKSGDCNCFNAVCLSFHPVKHLCCGEGGAILTNSQDLAEKTKRLRSHGIHRPDPPDTEIPWFYEQIELGWNYRMTDIQAALGLNQLKKVDQMITKRREIARLYDEVFGNQEFEERFKRPNYDPNSSWHLYIIRFHEKGERDRAHKFLKQRGILTQVHYIPLYKHPYFAGLLGDIKLDGAEKYYKGCLSIPIFPELSSDDQEKIILELKNFLNIEDTI